MKLILLFLTLSTGFSAQIQWDTTSLKRPPLKNYLNKLETEITDKILPALHKISFEYSQITEKNNIKIIFSAELSRDAIALKPQLNNDQLVLKVKNANTLHQQLPRLLAHEIFHLYYWKISGDQPDWLEEGLAEYFASTLYGDMNFRQIRSFFESSHFSFLEDYHSSHSLNLYGGHSLYMSYLSKLCSDKSFLSNISSASKNNKGIAVVDSFLRAQKNHSSVCSSFINSVIGFSLARVINRNNYALKEPSLFHLLNTSVKTNPSPAISRAQIKSLKPLESYFLSPDLKNLIPVSKQINTYYIRLRYPFDVSTKPFQGLSSKSYGILLLRTH